MKTGDRAAATQARRLGLVLFGLVFWLGAYFHNGYGWNQTARIDPIWAFVEPGPNQWTLRIDDFLTNPDGGINTGDFAHNPDHSPHYYSNKAPGATLLGIPAYFVLYHAERLVGIDPLSIPSVLVNTYLLNLWVTVLPVALSALFLLCLMRHLTGRWRRATVLTILLYAGTLMWPFSTMTWAHTSAAAFLVMSLTLFVLPGGSDALGKEARARAPFLAGLLAGVAVLTDYGAAPFALSLLAASWLWKERRSALRPLILGGLGPLLVFALYHWALFGSPFRLASSYSTADMLVEGDVLGMFGRLRLAALWGLTLSPVRGIFFFMPVLLLALPAIRSMRDNPHRAFIWLAVANMAGALLINLSYNTWQGGVSAGARYQIIALPFYIGLIALSPERRWTNGALYALGAVSVANMFAIAAVSPMAPDAFRGSPLLFSWWKLFDVLRIDLGIDPLPPPGSPLSRGSLHIYPTFLMREWGIGLADPEMARYAAFNLGERIWGLRGTLSLLPLVAAGGALATWAVQIGRRIDSRAGAGA